MSTAQEYRHEDLVNERQEIRLLKIIPSTSQSSVIECSLETVQLSNCPRFVALSYTWGSEYAWGPEDPRTIHLDSKEFSVQPNLWHALDVLRGGNIPTNVLQSESDPPKDFEQVTQSWVSANNVPIGDHGLVFTSAEYFWIDAICINQKNEGEKTVQVNMMGTYSLRPHMFLINPAAEHAFPKTESLPSGRRPDAVRGLLSKRYWNRMWIIQELILAREILVLCGTRILHWNWIDLAMVRLPYPAVGNFMLNQVAQTNELRKQGIEQPKQSLTRLISLSKNFECQNLFDRVYGLLGILKKPDDVCLHLKADYSLSREDMFFEVIRYVNLVDTEEKDEYGLFLRSLESALKVHMRRDHDTRKDYGRLLRFDETGRACNLYEFQS